MPSLLLAANSEEVLFEVRHFVQVQNAMDATGIACDAAGNIYITPFTRRTIGRITPEGKGGLFLTLEERAYGKSLAFAPDGTMMIIDTAGNKVLRFNPANNGVSVLANIKAAGMLNDLAITPEGVVYVTDFRKKSIWRVDADGRVAEVISDLPSPNGIEVSPDGQTLYVGVWGEKPAVFAFSLAAEGIEKKRLLRSFVARGFPDGMRCDVDGNLYVTFSGDPVVQKISANGELLRRVEGMLKGPAHLCFGGPDGRTVYVANLQGYIRTFRVDRPGLAWQRWQKK
ncbi:MAG: SMP-30/gluconolactonase/LRE family protein [Verrucomicrobiota bacterium]